MAQKPSISKGTRDFSPTEVAKRNYIFSTIKQVFEVSMQSKHPIDKFHYDLMAEITADNGIIMAEPLIDIPRESK